MNALEFNNKIANLITIFRLSFHNNNIILNDWET